MLPWSSVPEALHHFLSLDMPTHNIDSSNRSFRNVRAKSFLSYQEFEWAWELGLAWGSALALLSELVSAWRLRA
jgi:hypothetical protein